jgi:hypothetical protein
LLFTFGKVVVIAAVPVPDMSPDKVIVLFGAAVIAAPTKAVVATEVSLSPGEGVGAFGSPVNVGEAIGAFAAKSVIKLVTSLWAIGKVA